MNKNIVKLIAILVMCFMLVSVLVACKGETGPKGDKGEQGIQGIPGKDGADGKDGVNGTNGTDGKDGLTPTIGENGNWFIGDVDTGVKAEGVDGTDGKNGVDATDCENHTWDSYVLNPHTIDKAGVTLLVCENCGDAKFDYDNHNYNTVIDIKAPTMDENGAVTIGCACGDEIVEEIPSLDNSRFYMVEPGHCMKADKYSCSLFDAEKLVDCFVEFEVENDRHDFVEFSEEAIANGDWKLVIPAEVECECSADKLYYPVCVNGCGTDFSAPEFEEYVEVVPSTGHVFDLENGWHEAEKKPGESPCMQDTVFVNECTVCYKDGELLHVDCVLTRVETEAPGHTWGEWTLDSGLTYVRFCTVCPNYELTQDNVPYQTVTLDLETLPSEITVAPTCLETGVRTYTYTHEDGTTIKHDVVVDANGHNYDATSDYFVTFADSIRDGDVLAVLNIKCTDCDHVNAVDLGPAYNGNGTDRVYYENVFTVAKGHCLQQYDLFTATLTGEYGIGSVEAPITITFEVDNGYSHDKAPAEGSEELVLVEGTEKNYYVYKCSLCGQWIVAYYVNK